MESLYAAENHCDLGRTDINYFIKSACTDLANRDGMIMKWCRKMPQTFKGGELRAKYLLVDTKKSPLFYFNTIEKSSATFCLDNKPNELNEYLIAQSKLSSSEKSPIRLAQNTCKGSTTILDCGDYHVMRHEFVHRQGKKVEVVKLQRLVAQDKISPPETVFQHETEEEAQQMLNNLFPPSHFHVSYEPCTIHFHKPVDDTATEKVESYNPDFTVRKKATSVVYGIEVKSDMAAYEWKKDQVHAKALGYSNFFGAPCFLLTMRPKPKFFVISKNDISELADITAFIS